MSEVIFMVNESNEGGYTTSALGYSIFTEADSWEELRNQVKDAVQCHFDDENSHNIRLHFVKDEMIKS